MGGRRFFGRLSSLHSVFVSKESEQFQADFLGQIAPLKSVFGLFEHVPGAYFFVKNRESRFVAGNRLLLDRLGLKDEMDLVGTCDADHFPPEVCAGFVSDDARVFESGESLSGRIELGYNGRRILEWYVTTKIPLYDRKKRVIGLMGFTRAHERSELLPPARLGSDFEDVINLIRQKSNQRVSTEEMARVSGLSVRQLRRRFRDVYGLTPYEFERTSRIMGASEALVETDQSISEIALDFGFCDQSAFSVQFRKHTGYSPAEYRKMRQKS